MTILKCFAKFKNKVNTAGEPDIQWLLITAVSEMVERVEFLGNIPDKSVDRLTV